MCVCQDWQHLIDVLRVVLREMLRYRRSISTQNKNYLTPLSLAILREIMPVRSCSMMKEHIILASQTSMYSQIFMTALKMEAASEKRKL